VRSRAAAIELLAHAVHDRGRATTFVSETLVLDHAAGA
jgi:hypothetical protein